MMPTEIINVTPEKLLNVVTELITVKHLSLKLITASDDKIWYVFGEVILCLSIADNQHFPSLSKLLPAASYYERKLLTFFGLKADGLADQRQLILHDNWPTDKFPLRKDFNWQTRPDNVTAGQYEFTTLPEEGIYEIPVGPIHAGIIEPGHFRFSVMGEAIRLLEPKLGYTHKGSEKLFEQLPLDKTISLAEKISGDSSFSHALAYCLALEQLSDTTPPNRANYLRVIYAELERLANHFGDIGAIMLDTGYNFGGAHGARLRERIMQINQRLTGNRFLRGVNICGGVTQDITSAAAKLLRVELVDIKQDFMEVLAIAKGSGTLLNRLTGTGKITQEIVLRCGATGVAAKATGIAHDVRIDFPYAAYTEIKLPTIATEQSGDVYARFYVRVKEVFTALELIDQALKALPTGSIKQKVGALKNNSVATALVEGWRGEILYFVTTDKTGTLSRVAPQDPSFINWTLLSHAGLHNMVPDFPLINKSFNLSYTGYDL
ncbi:MAG: NADH-quinone oxidoreductase subunit C [Patescibacteria group bacterium]|jgi:Ni,Fe-hydrogenase III large subunit